MAHYPKWLPLLMFGLIFIHLNYWMWDDGRIVLGFPVNLLYHVVFSLLLYPLMLFVVKRAWPRYLGDE